MHKIYIWLALTGCWGLLNAGCAPQEHELAGEWQAVAFYEDGKTVPTKLDSVALRLTPEGGYEFRSQGLYRESGNYHCSMFYLFLTDTLAQPVKEHTIKVLYVSADSLKIRMSNADREQVLFFTRKR